MPGPKWHSATCVALLCRHVVVIVPLAGLGRGVLVGHNGRCVLLGGRRFPRMAGWRWEACYGHLD
eukprot:13869714-Alexandrium_andersonii.AAC.1